MDRNAYAADFLTFQSTPPVKAATLQPLFTQNPFRFQSTPPVKAATLSPWALRHHLCISIHAAREGGDSITA